MRQLALCLLSLLLAASVHADGNAAVDWEALEAATLVARQKFSEQLPKLKPIKLFRIDPGATRSGVPSKLPPFHDWVVVATAAPSNPPSEAAISQSLARIVSTDDNGVAACFDPHHGLTLTDGNSSFDVVLCFECWRYIVYTSDGVLLYADSFTARGESEKWEQVFTDAGLPVQKRK